MLKLKVYHFFIANTMFSKSNRLAKEILAYFKRGIYCFEDILYFLLY